MVVSRLVKELLEFSMHLDVVFARGDLKVGDPSEFAIDVPLLSTQGGPGWHACASDGVLLKGVKGLLMPVSDDLLLLAALVEILLFNGEEIMDFLLCKRCGFRCYKGKDSCGGGSPSGPLLSFDACCAG